MMKNENEWVGATHGLKYRNLLLARTNINKKHHIPVILSSYTLQPQLNMLVLQDYSHYLEHRSS